MANVLYLSYDGMTDQLGQSQVLPYLVGLSKLDFRFHLISFEKQEHFSKSKSIIERICADAQITWHPLVYHKWPPVISTMYDIRVMTKKCFQLHQLYNFKIVHCRSYITPFAGQALKKHFAVKFIFDMRGFYADERVDGHIWNQNNPIFKWVYNYFKRAEKNFLKNADHIISLTSKAEKIIQSWSLKNEKLPITVIPCCADLSLFDYHKITEESKTALRKKLGISMDANVIIYLGAIGSWYMLDEMLDFLTLINKNAQRKILSCNQ
ncbi:MAG: glycosyltransferase [Bacteroidetes bacterium]|nr:glycosyltransferase [Bacteroidota bacterium]